MPEVVIPSLPDKVDVCINVFTYDGRMSAGVFSYCCRAMQFSRPYLNRLVTSHSQGYPTDRMRNAACRQAKKDGFHFLLMLDDDMAPDVLVGHDPAAKGFLSSSLEFALAQPGPVVVAAPYCSAPPLQEVLVMKNREVVPDVPLGAGYRLDKYTRDEAAVEKGIGRVAALPTGVMLVDLRIMDLLPPPWFSYEYLDPPFNTDLASTEDVVFTRNASWLGVPQFCNWDSWAGHDKKYRTGKPRVSPVDHVPDSVYAAWDKGWRPTRPSTP